MPDITAWSSTPSSNTTVNGTNIATGMSPGNVDNALRDIMACIAGTFSDLSAGKTGFYAGSSGLAIASGGTGATTAAGARAALGLLEETTTAEYRANTADRALSTDQVWAAAEPVALTDAATVAVDMDAGFNFTVTLGGNRTLGNPTNVKHQSGFIAITQDGTGSRTLAYGTNWEFDGGTAPTLSTAAGAKDILYYQVLSATSIHATLRKAVS